MSMAISTMFYQYGILGELQGNIFFMDESTVIYPSGKNVILHNIEMHSQKFIPLNEKMTSINAMAISPNRRYLAVSETLPDRPIISIFDLHTLRKRKILSTIEITSKNIISIAFSPDSKYILAQSGEPDWMLVYWIWEKSKILATIKSCTQPNCFVSQISFNPQDNTQVCIIGQGVFKIYRYNENAFKQVSFQKIEIQEFTCHSWLADDRLAIGTLTGKILIFDCGELKVELDCTTMSELEEKQAKLLDTFALGTGQINFIMAYGKSLMVSCGNGLIQYFEKSEIKDGINYRRGRQYIIPKDTTNYDSSSNLRHNINSIGLSPQESLFVCSTDTKQIFTAQFSTTDIAKMEQCHVSYLSEQFHSAMVTGLDMCIRKPMIATCSTDRSIHIWNFETWLRRCELYISNHTFSCLEHFKSFAEEAFSIAIHPSGLYICVGFSDKLRLMNILIDDIRTFLEIPIRACKECSFSNGGHLFAVVSGNLVQIFSSTSYQNIMNLKGHNGKVKDIKWSIDDTRLYTCGMDGAIYEWEASTGKRLSDSVLKSCSYNSICLGIDENAIYAVGTDRKLKKIMESQIVREINLTDGMMTSLVISKSGRMMFGGMDNGSLRIVKFPLTTPVEWTNVQAHNSKIVKLKISFDDQYLTSVSDDASVIIWTIHDREGRKIKKEKEIPYAEEILITKSDLQEKNTLMCELKVRVEEMKMENEYQIRLKDMSHNEKMQELTDKFIMEMESLKTKNQVLKGDKDKQELTHTETINELVEKNTKEFHELETANNQKLMLEYEKLQELQSKSQRMQEEYEWQLNEVENSRKAEIEKFTQFYESKVKEKTVQLDMAHDEAKQKSLEYEETKKQIEEDADHECIDLKNRYERRLREEKEANVKLKGEFSIIKKNSLSLQKAIDDHKSEIKNYMKDINKLNINIKNLEKDISGLKKEVAERDETIQDKEKRIYDLKKKNQELEKFKFVLDYKIKELKKQIEPRENDIKEMKEQIQEMESELERFSKQNESLIMQNEASREKLSANEKEIRNERQKIRDAQLVVKRFRTDLHNCVGYIQYPQLLKDAVRAMNTKYQSQSENQSAAIDGDIQKEYARQHEHLEHSVTSVRKKLKKVTAMHKLDNVRIMQENVSLIREINELRKELKISRIRVHDLEAALGLHRKANRQNANEILAQLTKSNKNAILKHKLQEKKNLIEEQKEHIERLSKINQDNEEKIKNNVIVNSS
ncbi:WD repeat-containing protein [Intoshia linei]|uniref:WD repeat-containing protein n=1 Tax=Intoshia linei TaxID=1819745 RepID=A0A177B7Z2_9BILA|nr:WD repeat-containing protein [Intoshia linei]